MKKTIGKPENWQDFESLCKKLWGEIWKIPNKIKKNGRLGQEQAGVDIFGIPMNQTKYWGIQAKGKDNYTNAKLTEKEIVSEIEKAKKFQPELEVYIIATTQSKDSKIEEFIRLKDLENRDNGSFEILLFCWEDIVDLLEENQDTYQWYLNGNSININGNNITYNAGSAGNYSVVITNNGCSATSSISKLIAAPSVNAANTAFCEGGSSLITGISTGFTSPTYQWKVSTDGGLNFVNATGTGTTSLTYTATTAGKYQLEVTDGGIVSTSLTNLTYSKKVGFDILKGENDLFSFDVEVYAKYKPEGSSVTNITKDMLDNYRVPNPSGRRRYVDSMDDLSTPGEITSLM